MSNQWTCFLTRSTWRPSRGWRGRTEDRLPAAPGASGAAGQSYDPPNAIPAVGEQERERRREAKETRGGRDLRGATLPARRARRGPRAAPRAGRSAIWRSAHGEGPSRAGSGWRTLSRPAGNPLRASLGTFRQSEAGRAEAAVEGGAGNLSLRPADRSI